MKICLVGGARFGMAEPLAGGMEVALRTLGEALAERDHEVTVFAGVGDQPTATPAGVRWAPLCDTWYQPSDEARADVSMPPELFMAEHDAYLELGVRLRDERFDVVHNHSLHYLPPLYDIDTPMVHTLHSPPTPWLEAAHRRSRRRDVVTSVSAANASLWGELVDTVVHNGVDLSHWMGQPLGPKDDWLVWSGRLVPEKAPHLAIDAARAAGRPIRLAGPVHDEGYFAAEVAPRLGDDAVHLGHLAHDQLAALVAASRVAVITPMWPEPYGLVAAEALAAGTPVAAFAAGGLPEVIGEGCGALAELGDVAGLARAIDEAWALDPARCRAHAEVHCAIDRVAERFCAIYRTASAA